MFNNFFKIVFAVFLFVHFSCYSTKVNAIDEISTKSENSDNKSKNFVKTSSENDSIHFHCEGEEEIVFLSVVNSHISYTLKNCIISKSFFGDKEYISQLSSLIEMEFSNYEIFSTNRQYKFRGQEIFEILFDLSNNFNCMDNEYEQTVFKHYYPNLSEMIKNIDGLKIHEYVIKNSKKLTDAQKSEIRPHISGKCGDAYDKYVYSLLKNAKEKGLINLKSFGEN